MKSSLSPTQLGFKPNGFQGNAERQDPDHRLSSDTAKPEAGMGRPRPAPPDTHLHLGPSEGRGSSGARGLPGAFGSVTAVDEGDGQCVWLKNQCCRPLLFFLNKPFFFWAVSGFQKNWQENTITTYPSTAPWVFPFNIFWCGVILGQPKFIRIID